MRFGVCSHCELPPSTPSPCLVSCPTPASSKWGGCAACPGHCCSSSTIPVSQRSCCSQSPTQIPNTPLLSLYLWQDWMGPSWMGTLVWSVGISWSLRSLSTRPFWDFCDKRNPAENHEVNATAKKVTMWSYDHEGCGWEVSEVEGKDWEEFSHWGMLEPGMLPALWFIGVMFPVPV